jgi:universal stress protein F
MYQTIIVPVAMDQLERGEAILTRARHLRAEGGRIVLLNVVEDFQGYLAIDFPVELIEQEQDQARLKLEALRNRLGISADIEVRYGGAAREIIKAAEELSADLVIVASHRPGIANYLIGATADRVVRHCPVSVLVDR